MELEIRGFGSLFLGHGELTVDHFPTRQVKELLAFLLINPRRGHPREELMTLLWPEKTVSEVRHRFNIVLWRVRLLFRQLELPDADFIQSTREQVRFQPERPFRFDQTEFCCLVNEGLRCDSLPQRKQRLTEAVDLWRGEPFVGLYTDYVLAQRENLALLRIRAWRQLLADCYTQGSYQQAVGWAKAILREDPLRESVHRELMRCYVAQGRPVLAVRQFHTCAEIMKRELGIRPFAETIALYREIVEE